MNSRDSSVDIVSLFIFSIIFCLLRTFSITLILDGRYMCDLKHIDIKRRNMEEMKGVNDNASASSKNKNK